MSSSSLSTHKVLIIRHSERLDKVDKELWYEQAKSQCGTRTYNSVVSDSPITENGYMLADNVAITLSNHPYFTKFEVIYCSRLRRRVETASIISRKLNLPICVSKGLSLAAIKKKAFIFEYMPLDEIQNICQNTVIYDGDDDSTTHGTTLYKVDSHSWKSALESISQKSHYSLVVGHSEIIKELSIYHPPSSIPYCCISEFTYSKKALHTYKLESLVGCENNKIYPTH